MRRRRVWIAGFLLLLIACSPLIEDVKYYTAPNTPEGQVCVGSCQQVQGYCYQQCEMQADDCKMRAESRAHEKYRDYVRERRREGSKIKKSESDFVSYYQCEPTNCLRNCTMVHDGCFTACGGGIQVQQQCTAFCEQ